MRVRWCAVWLPMLVLLLTTCAPSPRFGSLRFGPRSFELETRVDVIELKSGMLVALMPDARTNLVSVDVRYKVGAADDPAGLEGMAHLVEHLTFELRAAPNEPSLGVQLSEATLIYNAYTSADETHYGSVALAERLHDVLELEARRIDPQCDQLVEAVFARERDVVLAEAAERTSFDDGARPGDAAWPAGHPYTRPVGGTGIARATLDDVCAFLDDHYAPNRAILVVTGNFDRDTVARSIVARFGPLARRSQGRPARIAPPELDGKTTQHAGRKPVVVVSFAAPGPGGLDEIVHELGVGYLNGELASSRGEGWNAPSVWTGGGKRARVLNVAVPLDDVGRAEEAADAVYAAAERLSRRRRLGGFEALRARRRNDAIGEIDGFWGRGRLIADHLHYARRGALFADRLEALDRVSPALIAEWASRLTRERSHVAVYRPVEDEHGAADPPRQPSDPDPTWLHDLEPERMALDPAEAARPIALPAARPRRAIEQFALANGLNVVLAPIQGALVVDARLQFPAGDGVADVEEARRVRAAAFTLQDDLSPDFVDYDLKRLDWVFGLGTDVDVHVDDRTTTFSARGMALFADWHVWRLFWRLHAGIYPEYRKRTPAEQRERDEARDELRERVERWDRIGRVVSEALFGPGHYWLDAVLDETRSTRAELDDFRQRRFGPRGATLIIAGGFDADDMRAHVVELFGAWKDRGRPAKTPAASTVAPRDTAWIVVADEDATQISVTVAVGGLPRQGDPVHRAVLLEIVKDRLRGAREGLGATYGLAVGYEARGELAALRIDGRLEPAHAGSALSLVVDELASLHADPSAHASDFARARRRVLARALADAGSATDLASELESLVSRGIPVAERDELAARIAGLTLDDLVPTLSRDLDLDRLVVVVGGPVAVAREAAVAAGAEDLRVVE